MTSDFISVASSIHLWTAFRDFSKSSSNCPNEHTERCSWVTRESAAATLVGRTGTLYVSHVCGCLLLSRIVFDICSRQICLGLVVFQDKKSTERRYAAVMSWGSWWGCLWLIFPLATWQGEDKAPIMNCDTLMSLSSSDNTWSALLPFNLWYQWGKLQANKGFESQRQNVTLKQCTI